MNSKYTRIITGFSFAFVLMLSACGGGAGDAERRTEAPITSSAPSVTSTSPARDATGFAVNGAITATFSKAMDAATLTQSTFTLNGVTGSVSYSGTTAAFTPSSNLDYSTDYTASISTGAKDEVGNAMETPYTWSFRTGTASDTTPPSVTSTSPANGATNVAVNSAITATFSENMNASTVTTATFTLNNGVTGTVTYSGTTATFTPSANLAYSTTYTATVTTGVRDAAGNALATNKVWTFTTGTAPDITRPTVTSTSPASSATNVAVNSAITATFSENMNASTVTTATFTLNNGVTGTVTYSGTTATFTPSGNLAYSTTYTATVTTGVRDAAGNALVTNKVWTFTTQAQPPSGTVRILVLHHSTGFYIWQGSGGDDNPDVPAGVAAYNLDNGTNYEIDELWYPSNTYPYGSNNPYDYWNLWVNTTDTSGQLDLEALAQNYDVIVFKHCYPVGEMYPNPVPANPDASSMGQTLENYQAQYTALKAKMHEFGTKKFIVWTAAALREEDTNETAALLTQSFVNWVKDEWGATEDNIFVWDFYNLETEDGIYLTPANASSGDSHPNITFAASAAPKFVKRLIDVIEGRGDAGNIKGE